MKAQDRAESVLPQNGTPGKNRLRQEGRRREYLSARLPGHVEEVLCSKGRPLDTVTRSQMEQRFGHDFSQIRIHTDERASEAALDLGAQAYAFGNAIIFGAGEYAPGSTPGRALLEHELAHVIEQRRLAQPSRPVVQRQAIDIKTIPWEKGVEKAEEAAKKPATKKTAENYYKELIVQTAQTITAPAPLVDKKPGAGDIVWSWSVTKEYAATTDPKKVDKSPNDYWKWLTFNPAAVQKEEAFTRSTILHELDHAAHARALYDEWKKSATPKGGTWTDFYLAHFAKWTEKEIPVQKTGIIGVLSGLPEKIRPSVIEFRAYVNQFVNYFHKFSVDRQSFLANGVVLFYPLRIQKVTAKISDPGLDLSKARQRLIDYFKSPPVKDATQKSIVQARIAAEFKSALYLSRPAADHAQMAADFSEIVNHPLTPEERKAARASYKPEP